PVYPGSQALGLRVHDVRAALDPTRPAYTTLFRSVNIMTGVWRVLRSLVSTEKPSIRGRSTSSRIRSKRRLMAAIRRRFDLILLADRKSTRLNSSHVKISYAVFCLKKKHSRVRRGQ